MWKLCIYARCVKCNISVGWLMRIDNAQATDHLHNYHTIVNHAMGYGEVTNQPPRRSHCRTTRVLEYKYHIEYQRIGTNYSWLLSATWETRTYYHLHVSWLFTRWPRWKKTILSTCISFKKGLVICILFHLSVVRGETCKHKLVCLLDQI